MPRNRNQPPVIVPLTWEQKASFSTMGNMLVGGRDETELEVLVRVFGSRELAEAGWFTHRGELMAEDFTAGWRPIGFWWFEHHREPPPSEQQAAILRELGELTADEEEQLATWAALAKRPEPPTDLGIDHLTAITIDPTPEDTHDIDGDTDAAPVSPRPAPTGEAVTAEEGEAPEGVPEAPVILPMRRRGIVDDRRPPESVGWETHDA